jgi:hypothetical protein
VDGSEFLFSQIRYCRVRPCGILLWRARGKKHAARWNHSAKQEAANPTNSTECNRQNNLPRIFRALRQTAFLLPNSRHELVGATSFLRRMPR